MDLVIPAFWLPVDKFSLIHITHHTVLNIFCGTYGSIAFSKRYIPLDSTFNTFIYVYLNIDRCRNKITSVVTRLYAERPRDRGSIPDRSD
jgi:hypothetical protein